MVIFNSYVKLPEGNFPTSVAMESSEILHDIHNINHKYTWLVVEPYPSEKYESVSWDDYSQYMENTKMFQTTNQTNIPSDSNTWLAGKSSTKIWRFDGNIIKLNAGCSSRLTDFRRIYQP